MLEVTVLKWLLNLGTINVLDQIVFTEELSCDHEMLSNVTNLYSELTLQGYNVKKNPEIVSVHGEKRRRNQLSEIMTLLGHKFTGKRGEFLFVFCGTIFVLWVFKHGY